MPISHKWMSATNRNMNYPTCKAKNRWCSIATHSRNGAVSVLLSLSPINAANRCLMSDNNQVTGELSYLQDHKLSMLRWCSFYCIAHSTFAAINDCFHNNLNWLVVFLSDYDVALWQGQAEIHSCAVHFHTTKNNVPFQKFYCACYISVCHPISTSYYSPFAHNISLTETFNQAK